MKKIVAVSLAAGIALTLAAAPIHAAMPHQTVIVNPRFLSVGADAFPVAPIGSIDVIVDVSSTSIDLDDPLFNTKNGELFHSLGSYGSMSEDVLLPSATWGHHIVRIFASAFPSSSAAQNAFIADYSNLNQQCTAIRGTMRGAQIASCAYSLGIDSPVKDISPAVDSTIVGVVGSVEYVVDSFVNGKRNATQAQLAPAQFFAVKESAFVASNEIGHLQRLLVPANAPAPQAMKPRPAPVVKPRPLPIIKHAPVAAPAFTVTAWVTPSSMSYNAYPTLYVKSTPGASCSASVTYSTGRSPVSFDGSPQTLPANGTASWSWHEETVGSGGTATVDCTYHGQDHTADASFTVQ